MRGYNEANRPIASASETSGQSEPEQVFDDGPDSAEFLQEAAKGGTDRIERKSINAVQPPKVLADFPTLGRLSSEDENKAIDRYVGFLDKAVDHARQFSRINTIDSLDASIKEAELWTSVWMYDAMIRCLADGQYLTVPQSSTVALQLEGYKVYNDAAMRGKTIVRLIMPVRLADSDELVAAIRKLDGLRKRKVDEAARAK